MRKILLSTIIILLAVNMANAQSIKISKPSEAEQGSLITIRYIFSYDKVDKLGEYPKIEILDDVLAVNDIPNPYNVYSVHTKKRDGKGAYISENSSTYAIQLRAEEIGSYDIPRLSFELAGNQYTSAKETLKVVEKKERRRDIPERRPAKQNLLEEIKTEITNEDLRLVYPRYLVEGSFDLTISVDNFVVNELVFDESKDFEDIELLSEITEIRSGGLLDDKKVKTEIIYRFSPKAKLKKLHIPGFKLKTNGGELVQTRILLEKN